MDPDRLHQVLVQARAKLTWGESPEAVFSFLRTEGLAETEAWEVLESLKKERALAVRSEGIRKIVNGFLLALVPVVTYVALSFVGYRYSLRIYCIPVAVGLYGLWQFVGGWINLLAPRFGNEDLSE